MQGQEYGHTPADMLATAAALVSMATGSQWKLCFYNMLILEIVEQSKNLAFNHNL